MATKTFESGDYFETNTFLQEGQNVIKACLFNLVVLANSLERSSHCQDLVRIITEKFPCRIIFVRAEESAQEDYTRITRSIHTVGSGDSKVCCDQIDIDVAKSQINKVPFLVLPNFVPDLPIYILLGHDPTQDLSLLANLQRFANRIVYDVDKIENLDIFSERILAAMAETKTDFVDLNWARCKAWREIIARICNSQDKVDALSNSKTIHISFTTNAMQMDPKNELQAIYIQSWIAAQLNWTLQRVAREEGFLKITYGAKENQITVSIIPKESQLDPGAIFSIEILTNDDTHYLISHEGESKHVIVHSSNRERCEIPYSLFLSNFQRGPALVTEIFYQPVSDHYANMLGMLHHPEWNKNL